MEDVDVDCAFKTKFLIIAAPLSLGDIVVDGRTRLVDCIGEDLIRIY